MCGTRAWPQGTSIQAHLRVIYQREDVLRLKFQARIYHGQEVWISELNHILSVLENTCQFSYPRDKIRQFRYVMQRERHYI